MGISFQRNTTLRGVYDFSYILVHFQVFGEEIPRVRFRAAEYETGWLHHR